MIIMNINTFPIQIRIQHTVGYTLGKRLSAAGSFFLWQEISSLERIFLPLKGNFILGWEIHKAKYPFMIVREYVGVTLVSDDGQLSGTHKLLLVLQGFEK